MSKEILENYLKESISSFRSYKNLAEKAIEQVSDEEFFKLIDSEANSIALIVKHLGGNLCSRWTSFLTTDGEKPNRNRDAEFAETAKDTRESLMDAWKKGWETALSSLESLQIEDLGEIVKIRGEDFTVVKAINRSLSHVAYHVGQITLLAKHFRSNDWKSLSIPKNKSNEFNQYLAENETKGNYLEAGQEFAEKLK